MPDVTNTGLMAARVTKRMPHTTEAAGARDHTAEAIAGLLGIPWATAGVLETAAGVLENPQALA